MRSKKGSRNTLDILNLCDLIEGAWSTSLNSPAITTDPERATNYVASMVFRLTKLLPNVNGWAHADTAQLASLNMLRAIQEVDNAGMLDSLAAMRQAMNRSDSTKE